MLEIYYRYKLWHAKQSYAYYTEVTGVPNEFYAGEIKRYKQKLAEIIDPLKFCDKAIKRECVHIDGFLCPCEEQYCPHIDGQPCSKEVESSKLCSGCMGLGCWMCGDTGFK